MPDTYSIHTSEGETGMGGEACCRSSEHPSPAHEAAFPFRSMISMWYVLVVSLDPMGALGHKHGCFGRPAWRSVLHYWRRRWC